MMSSKSQLLRQGSGSKMALREKILDIYDDFFQVGYPSEINALKISPQNYIGQIFNDFVDVPYCLY